MDESQHNDDVYRRLGDLMSWMFFPDRCPGLLGIAESIAGTADGGRPAELRRAGAGWAFVVEDKVVETFQSPAEALVAIPRHSFVYTTAIVTARIADLLFQGAVEQAEEGLRLKTATQVRPVDPCRGLSEDGPVGDPYRKSLREPDESVRFVGVTEEIVEIAGFTVGRTVQQPGWRWSQNDPRALTDGSWCQAHHVGVVLSGRWGAELPDGTVLEWGPEDVFDCPPGHDGYTIGDEPCTLIEWAGLRTFTAPETRFADRFLAALLFTDLVDSTSTLVQLGDIAWHDVLSEHYQVARGELERFGGKEVETTGDGLLATFDAPARALRCAAAIRDAAQRQGLRIRAGVHVGEVGIAEKGIRGVAVHEAARIMATADADEILVSEIARALAAPAGLAFEDRGSHELKGLSGPHHLYAYLGGT